MTSTPNQEHEPVDGPVIRDRRRIDPQTGAVREPQSAVAPAGPSNGAPVPPVDPAATDPARRVAELEGALAERTADLQRLQAEYVNYKRRVDRDRAAVRDVAVAGVLTALLPVLDDIDRAREHGELDGGFKAVAESLERSMEGFGLQRYGQVGDTFDPRIHEALAHGYSDAVDGPTCQAIVQPGYRLAERILRPARVAVVEPPAPAAEPAEATGPVHNETAPADDETADG